MVSCNQQRAFGGQRPSVIDLQIAAINDQCDPGGYFQNVVQQRAVMIQLIQLWVDREVDHDLVFASQVFDAFFPYVFHGNIKNYFACSVCR